MEELSGIFQTVSILQLPSTSNVAHESCILLRACVQNLAGNAKVT